MTDHEWESAGEARDGGQTWQCRRCARHVRSRGRPAVGPDGRLWRFLWLHGQDKLGVPVSSCVSADCDEEIRIREVQAVMQS
jgi:hypothetical protein